jgi:hypothetical protein
VDGLDADREPLGLDSCIGWRETSQSAQCVEALLVSTLACQPPGRVRQNEKHPGEEES